MFWPIRAAGFAQINIAHPEEGWLFLLVVVALVVGVYLLLRVLLRGARGRGLFVLPAKPYQRVLLPAAADIPYSGEVVGLACRLVGTRGGNASLIFAYVIEVPRALAPDAPMPQEEAEAERALAQAAQTARECGLQAVTQVRKGRVAVEETLRALKEEKADLLVLAARPAASNAVSADTVGLSSNFTTEVARRAPCEVIIARVSVP